MKGNVVSIVVLVSVWFTSCEESTPSLGCGGAGPIEYSPGASPDLSELYSANLFEMGTYWVYEDVMNSSTDTVWVDDIRHEEGSYSACFVIPDEHHIRLNGFDLDYYWSFSGVQVFFDTVETPYYELDNNTIFPTSTSEGYDVLDSLTLGGVVYYNVYRHGPRIINYNGSNSGEEYYYFVDGIGLIRKERFQNGVLISDMELREYLIVL